MSGVGHAAQKASFRALCSQPPLPQALAGDIFWATFLFGADSWFWWGQWGVKLGQDTTLFDTEFFQG